MPCKFILARVLGKKMTAWRSGPLIQNGVNGNLPLTPIAGAGKPEPHLPNRTPPFPLLISFSSQRHKTRRPSLRPSYPKLGLSARSSHGHLGTSLASQEAVSRIISASLLATIELGCMGLLLGALLGLAMGFSGTAKPEGFVDLAGRVFGIDTYAFPPSGQPWSCNCVLRCGSTGCRWEDAFPPPYPPGAAHRLLPDQRPAGGRWPGPAGPPAAPGLTGLHPGSAAERDFRG